MAPTRSFSFSVGGAAASVVTVGTCPFSKKEARVSVGKKRKRRIDEISPLRLPPVLLSLYFLSLKCLVAPSPRFARDWVILAPRPCLGGRCACRCNPLC